MQDRGKLKVAGSVHSNALLTQSEVAARVGVSPRALEAWRLRGGGPPFIRISQRLVRYRPADVEDWLEKHIVNQNQGDQ